MNIKGVLIDVFNEKAEVVEIEKSLESYYKILDCTCIDITSRKIGDREFDIVCDDEGLFHEPQKISAITKAHKPALVGNLLIVKFDGEEDITSLDDDDIQYVMQRVRHLYTNSYPLGYPMITDLEY